MNQIVAIDHGQVLLVEEFLKNAGNSLLTFRYFEKRPISCIKNHICTLILLIDNVPLGYGHLDFEDSESKTWLGIAVSEKVTGLGYGKQMLKKLLSVASDKSITEIFLSVDNSNIVAQNLYKSVGFESVEQRNSISIFKWCNGSNQEF